MPNTVLTHLRTRIGKLCVAITGSSSPEMVERAEAAVKDSSFLEFRLDYLADPAAALSAFSEFLSAHNAATAIATCRRTENGGRFAGSPVEELGLLQAAIAAGFQIVDLGLESAEALPDAVAELRKTTAGIIVSFHDFEKTGDLDGIYARIAPFKPDFVKIVPTAATLSDNVTLLRFIERTSDETEVIGICMGDAGILSRVLGPRAGAAFTFAAASVGEETGPGQIAARTLVETYRIEDVDASTKIYGVAGDPVAKSLSPLMLNTAFRRETVNAVYLALQAADVKDLVSVIQQIPIHGISITMPHKQSILPYLEHTDPLTARIGACNTVLRTPDGKLYGFNTDVQGIVLPLEKRMSLRGARILVLGAGGSARAAVFGLQEKGAEVFILNRTPATAAKLARESGAKVIKREGLGKTSFDVILNTTPAGMAGQETASILTPDELNAKLVFDIVYNPVETPLLRMARAKGIPVITGVEMFVQQGARQFEIWTGKPAPEEEMLKVIIHSLRQSSGEPMEPSAPVATSRPVEEVTEPEDALDEPEVEPAPAPAARKKGSPLKPAAIKKVKPATRKR